jgi:hypothetical protein
MLNVVLMQLFAQINELDPLPDSEMKAVHLLLESAVRKIHNK